MPTWLEAGLWGLLGGGALVLGALVAWSVRVPQTVIASVMAFGSGVLISAVAFDLMAEAADTGGLPATAVGFVGGALAYLAANAALARRGARHRKRSGGQQPSEDERSGSGAAIAVGALLDGVPESVVLGLGLLGGGSVSSSVLAAVVISNVPEGLSSAAGMKRNGRSAGYVFGVWGGIALASGVAALVGYAALGDAPPEAIAVITAVAAGAILTMIADTMIPEAFERTAPGPASSPRSVSSSPSPSSAPAPPEAPRPGTGLHRHASRAVAAGSAPDGRRPAATSAGSRQSDHRDRPRP